MTEEAGGIGRGAGDPEIGSGGPQFEKSLLKPGKFTEALFEQNPRLREVSVALPEIFVANPGQPEATVVSYGLMRKHTTEFLGLFAGDLVDRTGDTLITVDWPKFTDVYDIRWRCLADLLAEQHPQGVKFFGVSFGGRDVLVGLTILKQLAEEAGFAIPIETVALMVAPISKATLQSRDRMGIGPWLKFQLAKAEPVLERITGHAIPALMPETVRVSGWGTLDLWEGRAITVRVRELARARPFQWSDFPEGLEVHYFGTDRQGNHDPLVNQPAAIQELRLAGVQVEEYWYKPDSEFGHWPASEEMPRLKSDLIGLFTRVDKVK